MKKTTSCQSVENTTPDEVTLAENEYTQLMGLQQDVLQMLALDDDPDTILRKLCLLAESMLPGSVASIMLKDNESGLMSVRTAPSIPEAGINALCGLKPGPGGGSCGNAVYRNEPQYVTDTFTDPRWEDLRQVAYDFNLCACWSMPIRNEFNETVGSFALSSFEHRAPSLFHKRLLETGASIVGIVLRAQKREAVIQRQQQRLMLLEKAFEQASEGFLVTNERNEIIEVNQAFLDIYGVSINDVKGKNPSCFSSGQYDQAYYEAMWRDISKNGQWAGEILNRSKDGSIIPQWLSIGALNDESGIKNYFAVFTDLRELRRNEEMYEHLAFHDPVTDLYNTNHLIHSIKSTPQNKTLLLLNINNFSIINTTYGYDIGNVMLKQVAELLTTLVPDATACRLQADEFALLYENAVDADAEVRMLKKAFFSHPFNIGGATFNITLSFGGASGNERLYNNATSALRQAKMLGKNQVHIFNADHDDVDQIERKKLIDFNTRLHHAIAQRLFIPYFQGIRDNRSGEIVHYEALARMVIDDMDYSPIDFLQPAKISGLLPEITKIMIDKSFKLLAKNSYSCNFNITEEDLTRDFLIDYLQQKSSEYGIEPSRITLEILEGISAHGKKNHLNQLSALKKMGYKLALDDFGADYSNFERVLNLDIDMLKIDGSYIRNIATDSKSYEITRAIAFFAHNAGIPCVAEFVHNNAVQKIIESLGIEYSQGYRFSVPSEEF